MSHKMRLVWLIALCLLSLFSIAAAPAIYGDDEGSIRGAAYLDSNRNGKMDEGESGVPWVYFTISAGEYSHLYHSEWRTTQFGHEYATGTFGPAPLPKGPWHITFHVPDGYRATTPTEVDVNVPGGDVTYAYLGLYPTGAGSASFTARMPASGFTDRAPLFGVLGLLAVGSVVSLGLGFSQRRK